MKKTMIALALLQALNAMAEDDSAFRLGEIRVSATPLGDAPTGQIVMDSDILREQDRRTVGAALDMAPGVNLSRVGARNEEMIQVRGFDLRQVPVFVDGIPVYVPYDGYVDLGRFTTFDLARIEVAKGFSSLTHGPNTLGGAINLIGRRPSRAFEGEVGGGVEFDNHGDYSGYHAYTNLGTNQGTWYAQFGLSSLDQPHFRLPDGVDATPGEDGGRRNNSDRQDTRVSLKLGLTPNATDEYAFGYVRQDGEKGNPPYAGTVSGVNPRYWQWPYWDKTSTYLIGKTAIGPHTLKARLYHDTYENSLYAYDDASYTTQKKKSSFRSWYDDYTNGASIEGDFVLARSNRLRAAWHIKEDVHREHDAGQPVRRFEDRTQSLALEDTHALSDTLSLVAGVSRDWRRSERAEDYNSGKNLISDFAVDDPEQSAVNAQFGVFQKFSDGSRLRATVARKSRFPTIKDRFSYRMGTALPNPGLEAERATHYELGYTLPVGEWVFDVAAFRANISNLIQSVSIDASACSSPPCSQMQNVARARSSGLEFDWSGSLGEWHGGWHTQGSYTLLQRDNLSTTARLTDTPRHKLFATLGWEQGAWRANLSLDAASGRDSSSDGRQHAGGFGVLHLKGGYKLAKGLLIEAGVRNLTDKEYAYAEGFPEPGRVFFAQFNLPL